MEKPYSTKKEMNIYLGKAEKWYFDYAQWVNYLVHMDDVNAHEKRNDGITRLARIQDRYGDPVGVEGFLGIFDIEVPEDVDTKILLIDKISTALCDVFRRKKHPELFIELGYSDFWEGEFVFICRDRSKYRLRAAGEL